MPEMIATRDAYGKTLVELGNENPRIVVLDADLWTSTKTQSFREAFPVRFFDMGIGEQNMMGVAAGLALSGLVPFASSFACFAMRGWEQIRVSIAIPHLNVKLVTTHAGTSVGEDGASAQMTEDIALMRALPGMTVIVPADAAETSQAVRAIAAYEGPVFMRLGRANVPVLFDSSYTFEIGRAPVLREGDDVAIVAAGLMVAPALEAAETLSGEGIQAAVINLSTVKPIDVETLVHWAARTGAVVTAEEHQIEGGVGSAVAEVLSQHCPVPVEMVGMRNSFGESGPPNEVLEKYGLTTAGILAAARRALTRRTGARASAVAP